MASYGQFTQIDLSDTGFLDPQTRDTRSPNREAARFALELSALSYDFEVGPWLEAGWTDISIQADERLMGGVADPATFKMTNILKQAAESRRGTLREAGAPRRRCGSGSGETWAGSEW